MTAADAGRDSWPPAPSAPPGAPIVAFYAPMKPPGHPTPSGDRRVGRLLWRALERAGYAPTLASEFRSWRRAPDPDAVEAVRAEGLAEAERLLDLYDDAAPADRPKLWFTYHLYYKAPDYLGPRVAALHGMPYVVAEASRSARRMRDEWAPLAEDAEAAIDLADLIFCMTDRDRPALEAGRIGRQEIAALPPFLDPGPEPAPRAEGGPPRLLTVAMMRAGDKAASYATLAAALAEVADLGWTLEIVGDGPERAAVEALFAPLGERVRFTGRIDDPGALAARYAAADLFVWPGVGEAYGMAYLEAQAAGAPVLAEDRPGVRDVVHGGALAPPDAPSAFAAELRALLQAPDRRRELARAARMEVTARHGLDAAAATLREAIEPFLAAS